MREKKRNCSQNCRRIPWNCCAQTDLVSFFPMLAAHKDSFTLAHTAHSNFNHYWCFLFPCFALLTCSLHMHPPSLTHTQNHIQKSIRYIFHISQNRTEKSTCYILLTSENHIKIYLLHFACFLHENCYKPIHGHHLIFCSNMNVL